jgi:hypothetical protein
MTSQPLPSPTIASLGAVLPQYGEFRFDRTLEAARHDIGNEPDPGDPVHAVRLRTWLNHWTCRIGYPQAGETDVFAVSLAEWWADAKDILPGDGQRLARLSDAHLQAIGRAYAQLYRARLPSAGPAGSAPSGRPRRRSCSTSSVPSRSPPGIRRSPPERAGATTTRHSGGT